MRLAEHSIHLGKGRMNKKFKRHEHKCSFLWASCSMLLCDYEEQVLLTSHYKETPFSLSLAVALNAQHS